MIKLKKLEPARCPWCGEIFRPAEDQNLYKGTKAILSRCCAKPVVDAKFFSGEVRCFTAVIILLFIVEFIISHGRLYYAPGIAMIILILYSKTIGFHECYKRYHNGAKGKNVFLAEKFLGWADIDWYSMNQGGIGLPSFRIGDNRIVVVCFVDSEGKPVSQTLCVRIQKKLLFLWKRAKIFLISDSLWKLDENGREPWEQAEKFVIFNNGLAVGRGRIK